jgi:hypothetical protein
METIKEFRDAALPAMDAAIGTVALVPALLPVRQIVADLQSYVFWLETASRELDRLQTGQVMIKEGYRASDDVIFPMKKAPTLITVPERFDFVYRSLEKLGTEFYNFKEEGAFPPRTKEHLNYAYQRLMEAMYCTRTSEMYYGELTAARG